MHPYKEAQKSARWKTAVAQPSYSEVDPVTPPPFSITRKTKVTAGSCFAHIARHLKASGYTYYNRAPTQLCLKRWSKAVTTEHSAPDTAIFILLGSCTIVSKSFGKFEPVDNQWRLPDAGSLTLYGHKLRREAMQLSRK